MLGLRAYTVHYINVHRTAVFALFFLSILVLNLTNFLHLYFSAHNLCNKTHWWSVLYTVIYIIFYYIILNHLFGSGTMILGEKKSNCNYIIYYILWRYNLFELNIWRGVLLNNRFYDSYTLRGAIIYAYKTCTYR